MIQTYASYVWACYGISAAVWVLTIWLAHRSHVKELQAARRRVQMTQESAP